jgi:hypothetical protein
MPEFPNRSIGEFRAVENERGLIIKFKMRAFPIKVRSGFMPGKCVETECWRAKKLINAILTNSKWGKEAIWLSA